MTKCGSPAKAICAAAALAVASLCVLCAMLIWRADRPPDLNRWLAEQPDRATRLAVCPEQIAVPGAPDDQSTAVQVPGATIALPSGEMEVQSPYPDLVTIVHSLGTVVVSGASPYAEYADDIVANALSALQGWPSRFDWAVDQELSLAETDYAAWCMGVLESGCGEVKPEPRSVSSVLRFRIKASNAALDRGVTVVHHDGAVLVYYHGATHESKWLSPEEAKWKTVKIECILPRDGTVQCIVIRSQTWEGCDRLAESVLASYAPDDDPGG